MFGEDRPVVSGLIPGYRELDSNRGGAVLDLLEHQEVLLLVLPTLFLGHQLYGDLVSRVFLCRQQSKQVSQVTSLIWVTDVGVNYGDVLGALQVGH